MTVESNLAMLDPPASYGCCSGRFPTNTTFLHIASRYDLLTVATAVVDLGYNVDLESKDGDGRTPLSYAAKKGHEAIVKSLVEKGVDLESKDNDD